MSHLYYTGDKSASFSQDLAATQTSPNPRTPMLISANKTLRDVS